MVQIKHLKVSFEKEIIHNDLSVQVKRGEKLAITGESGTGKSTLLNVIAGFIPNFDGEVWVDGIRLNSKNIATIRSKFAWLPQDTSLTVNTVEELFYAPFELKNNKTQRPTQQQIKSIFDTFEIPLNLLSKETRDISGGQKQRVLLASCLLLNKPLLLIDEPTSALDKTIKEKVTNHILSLQHLTVLAVTHDEYWVKKSDKCLELSSPITLNL